MNHESAHTHRGSSAYGHNRAHKEESFLIRLWKFLKHQNNDAPALQYFLMDKIILSVAHSKKLNPTKLSELMKLQMAGLGGERLKDPDPCNIITFPARNKSKQAFSLVPMEVTSDNPDELVDLLVDLDCNLKGRSIKMSPDASIRAVSPNWLIGSATHGGSHPPSPGSWPLEADETDWPFQLIGQQGVIQFANDQQAGVDIAILDTAPAAIDLEEAYEKWSRPDPENLFDRLLKPGTGKLHVHRGINTDIELMDCHPVGHNYLMSDHGLFVAGIINKIAPEANLHLFRVFTPYGSGSTITIAQGLLQILQMFRNPTKKKHWRPLIINCSFNLSIDQGRDFPVQLRGISTSLREIFEAITDMDGTVVVAAAGNDSDRDFSRYPATFENVIAVGALDKTLKPATYTNLSGGRPGDLGYMAFGGEPGDGQGIRGIYTSEFPVYVEGWLSFLCRKLTGKGLDGWEGPGHLPPIPPDLTPARFRYMHNTTGRAWWAGTSFATPVITGTLAAIWSDPLKKTVLNYKSARASLDNIQNSQTDKDETVIYVKQG